MNSIDAGGLFILTDAFHEILLPDSQVLRIASGFLGLGGRTLYITATHRLYAIELAVGGGEI